METSFLFHALIEAMFNSIWQALIIYLLCRVILLLLPWMSASFRYNVLFIGFSMSTFFFVGSLSVTLGQSTLSESINRISAVLVPQTINVRTFLHYYAWEISAVYIIGIFLQCVYFSLAFIRVNKLKRDTKLKVNEMWNLRMDKLKEKISLSLPVKLFFSEGVASPFTIGWWKPIIFVPMSAITNLSTSQLEAVLIHELAHIRRYDYLWNIIQRSMEIILFFNPVTWAFSSAINMEREYCCDDVVVGQNTNIVNYSKALLLLQQDAMASRLVMHAAKGETPLLNRIKRLSMQGEPGVKLIPRSIIFVGILVAFSFVGWVKPHEAKNNDDKKINLSIDTVITVRAVTSLDSIPTKQVKLTKKVTVRQSKVTSKGIIGLVDTVVYIDPGLPSPPAPPLVPNPVLPGGAVVVPKPPVSTAKLNASYRIKLSSPATLSARAGLYVGALSDSNMTIVLKEHNDKIERYFDSPEWKAKVKEIENQSVKLAKISVQMIKKVNSKERKAQYQRLKESSESLSKMFESQEWMKYVKDITKQATLIGQRIAIDVTDSIAK